MLDYAFQKAQNTESNGRCSLYAVAVSGRRIIGEGANNYIKTHPVALRHSRNHEKISIHAEMQALVRALKSGRIITTLYVARVKKDGTKGLAKPCKACQSLIDSISSEQGRRINVCHT